MPRMITGWITSYNGTENRACKQDSEASVEIKVRILVNGVVLAEILATMVVFSTFRNFGHFWSFGQLWSFSSKNGL